MPTITQYPPHRANANPRATSGCGVNNSQKSTNEVHTMAKHKPKTFIFTEILFLKMSCE